MPTQPPWLSTLRPLLHKIAAYLTCEALEQEKVPQGLPQSTVRIGVTNRVFQVQVTAT